MPLMPKRVKFRKSQRGRLKGNATRGNTVAFGDFGLQSLEGGWLSAESIEAGRVTAAHATRGEGRLYTAASARRETTSAIRKAGRDIARIMTLQRERAGKAPIA